MKFTLLRKLRAAVHLLFLIVVLLKYIYLARSKSKVSEPFLFIILVICFVSFSLLCFVCVLFSFPSLCLFLIHVVLLVSTSWSTDRTTIAQWAIAFNTQTARTTPSPYPPFTGHYVFESFEWVRSNDLQKNTAPPLIWTRTYVVVNCLCASLSGCVSLVLLFSLS